MSSLSYPPLPHPTHMPSSLLKTTQPPTQGNELGLQGLVPHPVGLYTAGPAQWKGVGGGDAPPMTITIDPFG